MVGRLEERCKKKPYKKGYFPLPPSAFTIVGYNDLPKPCLTDGCKGEVLPTANANVGRCYICRERYGWYRFKEENCS